MLPARIRYGLAIGLSSVILIAHVYVCATTPFAEAWGVWIASAVFAILLSTMFMRSSKVLSVARWVCYAGFVVCGIGVEIGLIGILKYSMDLAVYLAVGIAYALMSPVSLSGIHEAERQRGGQRGGTDIA